MAIQGIRRLTRWKFDVTKALKLLTGKQEPLVAGSDTPVFV